ncbi:unnamed protein product [Cylindrotheca closterium]|uniref:Presenilin n=1 Tax=Cylindrotheca closterium TaxID=2856 RepID=A0AAD2CJB5_9STRA|nr:unnamed protein product [Cylindrotheca closterium]
MPFQNDYRRQHDDENENQGASDHEAIVEAAEPSVETNGETFIDEESVEEEFEYDYAMSISELLYSTSSFYAIVVPVTCTMVLAALAVVFINNEDTVEQGAQQMAQAYQILKIDSESSVGENIGFALANGLIMVSVICLMTFVIVMLYRFECMKCLIGYMMLCSTTLLGFLGGHMYWVAIQIYRFPVDKLSYFLVLWNFAAVGVLAIFFGRGVSKGITQGYLISTSVILAWHLDYFDEYTTWTLLFMLALYDLCAVLTPCGPLKALVNLMSRDDAPEMPGLLYEAELPPEARRPGRAKSSKDTSPSINNRMAEGVDGTIEVPLAIARVYNLPVLSIPSESETILGTFQASAKSSNAPLLRTDESNGVNIPENPTPAQLNSNVVIRLPQQGGRIEKTKRSGQIIFIERDRHGAPKRVLNVDRLGRVFAESTEDFENGETSNTIRLGLGDFIFYSVLVAKAAQYSFTTFVACVLVILAGLGGTLVLLSVFHQALPALPISICLGIFFYFVTRLFVEPWVENMLMKPYYV